VKAFIRMLNWITNHIFPPLHPMGRIGKYEINSVDVTLAIYTLGGGIALALVYDNWLWLPVTILSMMAAMIFRMLLWGD
jgi:hypothetical protein